MQASQDHFVHVVRMGDSKHNPLNDVKNFLSLFLLISGPYFFFIIKQMELSIFFDRLETMPIYKLLYDIIIKTGRRGQDHEDTTSLTTHFR